MKATEFAYWLQGLFELAEPVSLTAKQTELIKRHLAMVFLHDIDRRYPADQQAALSALHVGDDADIFAEIADEIDRDLRNISIFDEAILPNRPSGLVAMC